MRPIDWRALSQAGKLWQYHLMKTLLIPFVALAATGAAPAPNKLALAPSEIVAAAPVTDWVAIAPADVLVMTLANGKQAIIQLMPPPFSQGWIGNIRKLAAARWWDGLSINRVQDNYVVQWGDASEKKALPDGLVTVGEGAYVSSRKGPPKTFRAIKDAYAQVAGYVDGFPVASRVNQVWPVHCYGMVGVGRNLSPDTGSGAELYAVIGHAPRHLDRNIAVVGRVISGIENLSSLPRGTGALGFYEKPEERVGITSIRLASELPVADQPRFEYLSTESKSFAAYAEARANRRDAFFNIPAGGADICNIPVPIRKRP
jgi:cyclophilin family peptidyl-prolyl cis-trans isomerase